jgi:signal transduction histidine kinase
MVLIGLHLQRAREWFKTDTGAAHSAIDSALDAHTQAMRETTETVRHLREGLGGQVPMLADGYLDLDWLKDRVAAAGMSLDIDMEPVGSLSINAALALHRLLQEALTNTLRHAAATRISISIGPDGDSVRLRFGDDGRGSSIEEHTAGSRTGLRGMRARIERLGGRLDVHSTPYDGFVINAWLPRETGP